MSSSFPVLRLFINNELVVPITTFQVNNQTMVGMLELGYGSTFDENNIQQGILSFMMQDYMVGAASEQVGELDPKRLIELYVKAHPDIIMFQNNMNTKMYDETITYSNIAIVEALRNYVTGSTGSTGSHDIEFVRKLIKCGFDLPEVHSLLNDLCILESTRRFMNANARKIQKVFRDVISNPYHSMCQRRLLREFAEMPVVV